LKTEDFLSHTPNPFGTIGGKKLIRNSDALVSDLPEVSHNCYIRPVVRGLAIDFNIGMEHVGSPETVQIVCLVLALALALAFEFVNGFHDTANAVATVIYTNSLPPVVAVVWSGIWNLIGVLVSGGAVAFAIISLLPAELVTHVASAAGFAMVFTAATWSRAPAGRSSRPRWPPARK